MRHLEGAIYHESHVEDGGRLRCGELELGEFRVRAQ